ncbi:MAG: cupin domain-containing protein [Desulfobacula sp.]|nr:cupin domain-containing protein [Desulfobacula sp.]
MKVVNYKDVLPVVMDNEMVKNVAGRLIIGKQDGASNFCMRLFEMGKEGFTPRHTHAWEHEVFVQAGKGEVFIENKWHPVSAGSAIFVPANIVHQFRNISEQAFIFVCLIPSGAPEL